MEVVGYPDYLIYNDGRVWSKERIKGVKGYLYKGKFLKPQFYGLEKKYLQVELWNDKKKKKFTIHRLVAIHYIPNPENKKEVDHKNRDPSDNRVENLRWATRTENEHNKGISKNNTSGHKHISKYKKVWRFKYSNPYKNRYFKTKIDAIHYKFYYLLKINLLKKTKVIK